MINVRVFRPMAGLCVLAAMALTGGCDRNAPAPTDNAVEPQLPQNATTAPAAPAAPAAVTTVPAPYLGTWDQDATACAAPFSDMRLVIDSSSLRFYESVAEVQRVTPVAGGGIDVAAIVSGEGMTNEALYRLVRGDGDVLSVTVDDVTTRRARCR